MSAAPLNYPHPEVSCYPFTYYYFHYRESPLCRQPPTTNPNDLIAASCYLGLHVMAGPKLSPKKLGVASLVSLDA